MYYNSDITIDLWRLTYQNDREYIVTATVILLDYGQLQLELRCEHNYNYQNALAPQLPVHCPVKLRISFSVCGVSTLEYGYQFELTNRVVTTYSKIRQCCSSLNITQEHCAK